MVQLEKPRVRLCARDLLHPLLIDRCMDRASGGYVERFSWSGERLDPGFKRVRVTARQCYVFAHAAIGCSVEANNAARHGAEFLMAQCVRSDGQFVSRLATDGSVLDPAADLYDVAFGLFGLAWWYRLSGDRRALEIAERSVALLRSAMRSPSGRGFLAREGEVGSHQQNPHMHLFEAAIFLSAFTGAAAFRELADELFELACDVLFDPATGTLPEFFDVDWRPRDEAGAVRVEPGHHYEWVWLLSRYGAHAGRPEAFDMADRLFGFAQAHGHDPQTGLIYDAVDRSGRLVEADFRIWPNLEYLKALVAMRERHGDARRWDDEAMDATVERITDHFLTRRSGGVAADLPEGMWIDYLHGDSLEPKGDHVPASTLYHIVFAFTELSRHRAGHGMFSGLPW
jgi:mannose/cellobiose epimerase-like protein (N-acyl-D-glucosamine 2-epimerase family)